MKCMGKAASVEREFVVVFAGCRCLLVNTQCLYILNVWKIVFAFVALSTALSLICKMQQLLKRLRLSISYTLCKSYTDSLSVSFPWIIFQFISLVWFCEGADRDRDREEKRSAAFSHALRLSRALMDAQLSNQYISNFLFFASLNWAATTESTKKKANTRTSTRNWQQHLSGVYKLFIFSLNHATVLALAMRMAWIADTHSKIEEKIDEWSKNMRREKNENSLHYERLHILNHGNGF